MTEDEVTALIGDWQDPWPDPVVQRYGRLLVVRDDIIGAGSKVRFLDYLVSTADVAEFVFGGCPTPGFAQLALPAIARRYGKRVTLFMAECKKPTRMHRAGMALGADIRFVHDGMLPVTLARAREYAEESDDRMLLPLGLEHETAIASIVRVARNLDTPDEFWSVGSSGTLNRGLQAAWPNATAHVVSVGHGMSEREIGRAKLWEHPGRLFVRAPKQFRPPYPSAEFYDEKLWRFAARHATDDALLWNVA